MPRKRLLSEKTLTNGELKIKINSCVFNLSGDFWVSYGQKSWKKVILTLSSLKFKP